MTTSRLLTGLLLAATCGLAAADASVKLVNGAMVAGNGMTVYTFDNDKSPGVSMCSGPCVALWPPVPVAAGEQPAAPYSAITRADGSKQLAYKGKPLYFYKGDQKAGERTGDNFKDIWHIVKD
jgi:predicted lipoprotein with Yx(FWY)xxD motif